MKLVVGHCILNMNSRAPGIAIWEGVVEPVYEIIMKKHYWFLQLPCPEASYISLRRWWFVYEQYNNPHFRRMCKQLAMAIAEILLENNVRSFKLIGLGLSPSCGLRETQSDPSWGGKPREIDVSTNIRPGKGVWMEVLEEVFKIFKFNYRTYDLSPAIIYPKGRAEYTRLYPKSVIESIKELAKELDFNYEDLHINTYLKKGDVLKDLRSGKVLVAPQEAVLAQSNLIREYIMKGYGLIMVPFSNNLSYYKSILIEELVNQIENHLNINHEVLVYLKSIGSKLYQALIHEVQKRSLDVEYLK